MAAKSNYFKQSGLPHVRFHSVGKELNPPRPNSGKSKECRNLPLKTRFLLTPKTSGVRNRGLGHTGFWDPEKRYPLLADH
jgi:hypothetical protein